MSPLSPYPFQVDGIQFLVNTKRALLADEMGLGKTMQALLACDRIGAKHVLIICPSTLKSVWAGEIEKWLPEATYVIIGGTPNQRAELWAQDVTFYITNYMSFIRDADWLDPAWDVLILDEAQKTKNRKTQTFKALKKFARNSDHVWELTGTPIMRHPDDLWALLHLLAPKEHSSYWRFVREYCHVYFAGFAWVVGKIIYPEGLASHLGQYALRRTKDVLGDQLPEKTVQQIWVANSSSVRRQYNDMKKQMSVELDEGERISAVNVISMTTYLRMMATSPSLLDRSQDELPLTCAKTETLLDILDSVGGSSVVVYSNYRKVINRTALLLDEGDITRGVLTGETPMKARAELLNNFQSGAFQVLVCTTGTGGIGLNLQRASTAIFLDKDWVPAVNVQAQDRLHRIGQHNPVHIIEILARDTIDAAIEKLLTSRTKVTTEILKGILRNDQNQ